MSLFLTRMLVALLFATATVSFPLFILISPGQAESLPETALSEGASASKVVDPDQEGSFEIFSPEIEGDAFAEDEKAALRGSFAHDGEDEDDFYWENQENDLDYDRGPQIADPLQTFNRAMHHFNDRLYFWVLKPVAQGYRKAAPEPVRVCVNNFFTNIAYPIRFVSLVLQADIKGAFCETGRFVINTVWGLAGLFDPASMEGANLPRGDADLGQTFGLWNIGPGFYIVWPVFGPSSPRDTAASAGEFFLNPVSYLQPWYASTGVKSYEMINDTSFRIGDYEALKSAAIDPYIAMRDAYVQFRHKKIENKRTERLSDKQPKE